MEISMAFVTRLAALLIASTALCGSSIAQFRGKQNDSQPPSALAERQIRERVNAGTVGLAGGLLEGAPIHFATDIARAVNDSGATHVLPIVTRGPTENVNDLLYLKGIDAAIINSDSLEEYKSQVPQIQQRITYVLSLFPSELHIFVRPEIKSLQDLVGKKVNFNTQGTAAAYTGPLVFSRLQLNVNKTFIPHPVAMEQMKKPDSDMAAVVFITSKPIDPFLKGRWDPGFKFLPVPYDRRFADYYLPATIESTDYPSLLAAGERIDTISAPTILVSYNWDPKSDRYRRVARFVDSLFNRKSQLHAAGFDAKWKDVNLAASIPGLTRFRAAQEWLDTSAPKLGMRP